MAAERLQKIIAAAGITSRRKAEELITQGRVTVNGQVITELGSKADPEGRPTVMDLVKHVGERIYPVGRLDYASEGLLLMTNDGELANFLTRAASHVPKTYLVKIAGQASEEDIDKLRHGMRIGSKPGVRGMQAVRTAPAQVRIVREADNPWYEVTLIEGKNRQIRRMFEEIGHHVEKIKRVRYGSLALDVEPGKFRELTAPEVAALRKSKPRPAQTASPRSAAKGATRYIGKPRVKGRDQDRYRPRKERAHTAEEQGERAKPKFGRPARTERPKFSPHAEGERPKFAPRGERHAAGQERRQDGHQPRFERDSQRPRRFNRGDRRSEGRGSRSRFKH